MKLRLPSIFSAITLLGLAGCPSGGERCTPGASIECACPGGSTSRQVCEEDGKAYAACECGDIPDGGGSDGGGSDGGSTDGGGSDGGGSDGGGSDGGGSDGGGSDGGGDGGTGCTPGETRCASAGIQETCHTDALSWIPFDCSPMSCSSATGACVPLACTPNATRCANATTQETCAADGSGWAATSCAPRACDPITETCESQVCTPSDTRCADPTTLETCAADGSGWVPSSCSPGSCDSAAGSCVSQTCTPGTTRCANATTQETCANDGSGWVATSCSPDSCTGGACADPCTAAEAAGSYFGCEFWPVYLANSQMAAAFESEVFVSIVNPSASATANVALYAAGNPTPISTGAVGPRARLELALPPNALPVTTFVDPDTLPQSNRGNTAYKLTSSSPVAVNQYNPLITESGTEFAYTADASLLLPVGSLGAGDHYRAISLPHAALGAVCSEASGGAFAADQPSYLAIVGTRAGSTTVQITLAGATAAGGGLSAQSANTTFTLSVAEHEVIVLASAPSGSATSTSSDGGQCGLFGTLTYTASEYFFSDLSGTEIQSSAPVVVYTGADCRFVPHDEWACDHLEEQMVPTDRWGQSYVGVASASPGATTPGDLWHVMAAQDNTTLSVTPASACSSCPGGTYTLQAGQTLRLDTAEDFVLTADRPISLMQFLKGQQATGSTVGDPSMILAVPTTRYLTEYSFTAGASTADSYLSLVRPSGVAVTLDGSVVSATWSPIGATGWETTQVSVASGTHHLSATAPVGASVAGFGEFISYGFPAGMSLAP